MFSTAYCPQVYEGLIQDLEKEQRNTIGNLIEFKLYTEDLEQKI